jgi:hypothetical protein
VCAGSGPPPLCAVSVVGTVPQSLFPHSAMLSAVACNVPVQWSATTSDETCVGRGNHRIAHEVAFPRTFLFRHSQKSWECDRESRLFGWPKGGRFEPGEQCCSLFPAWLFRKTAGRGRTHISRHCWVRRSVSREQIVLKHCGYETIGIVLAAVSLDLLRNRVPTADFP